MTVGEALVWLASGLPVGGAIAWTWIDAVRRRRQQRHTVDGSPPPYDWAKEETQP